MLDGRAERYVLPLAFGWEDEITGALTQQLALARVRRGPRVGFLTDGFAVDALTRGMIEAWRSGAVLPLDGAELRFAPTSLINELDLAPDAEIRRLSAEQSNSSLVVGDRVVLKLVRRVLAGVHPEGEMTRALTERGFGNTAPLYGELVRIEGGVPHTVALLQGFVRNQGDGWGWTLEFLARAAEDLAVTHSDSSGEKTADAQEDVFAAYHAFATAIGTRLGELHRVLSEPSDEPGLPARPGGRCSGGGVGGRRDRTDRRRARRAGEGQGVAG